MPVAELRRTLRPLSPSPVRGAAGDSVFAGGSMSCPAATGKGAGAAASPFWDGVRRALPIVLGYVPVAFAFGVLALLPEFCQKPKAQLLIDFRQNRSRQFL